MPAWVKNAIAAIAGLGGMKLLALFLPAMSVSEVLWNRVMPPVVIVLVVWGIVAIIWGLIKGLIVLINWLIGFGRNSIIMDRDDVAEPKPEKYGCECPNSIPQVTLESAEPNPKPEPEPEPVKIPVYCTKCGNQIDGSAYCTACGKAANSPLPEPEPEPELPIFADVSGRELFGDKWLNYEAAVAGYEKAKAEAERVRSDRSEKAHRQEWWQEWVEANLAHVHLAANKYANEAERKADLEKMAAYNLHLAEWLKEDWKDAKAAYEKAQDLAGQDSCTNLAWSLYNLQVGHKKGVKDRARWQEYVEYLAADVHLKADRAGVDKYATEGEKEADREKMRAYGVRVAEYNKQAEAARKIQSLLKIAERPRGNDGASNGNEAVAALEKAQELASKHRLEIDFVVR